MRFLAQILTEITGVSRQKVVVGLDFDWSPNSWTHNIFRVYELLFWRRKGIRAEMSSFFDSEGNTAQCAHSWESLLSLIEVSFRKAFHFEFPVRIWIPVLKTPQGIPFVLSPFLFAIAYDTTTTDAAHVSTFSYNVTVTGSNPSIIGYACTDNASASDQITAMSYNGTSLSFLRKQTFTQGTEDTCYLYALAGCSTGTNSFAVTVAVAIGFMAVSASSYSGTDTSQTFTNTASSGDSTANPTSTSITVAGTNSWLVGSVTNNQTNAGALNTGSYRPAVGARVMYDSNATVSTGSNTVTAGNASANHQVLFLAELLITASATAVTTTRYLNLLGVGT